MLDLKPKINSKSELNILSYQIKHFFPYKNPKAFLKSHNFNLFYCFPLTNQAQPKPANRHVQSFIRLNEQ